MVFDRSGESWGTCVLVKTQSVSLSFKVVMRTEGASANHGIR